VARDDTLLLVAAGGLLYFLLRPASVAGGAALAPAGSGGQVPSTPSLTALTILPGPAVTVPLTPLEAGLLGVPAPGAPPSVSTAPAGVPTVPGTPIPLATAAVVVGVAGAALTDLQTAQLVAGLTLKAAQAGGTVVQYLQLADLGQVLQVIGTVGLVVDMAFTVLGDASDAQKAFDVAMDAVLIAALWSPVYGWAIAVVVGIVKLIVDLFGFSQGLSHAQREALERQRYGEHLAPMLADLGHAYSPREMIRVLIDWGTGYCGGTHDIAMMTGLADPDAPPLAGTGWVPIVAPGCYQWALIGGTYRGLTIPAAGLSVDDQAHLLVQYGLTDLRAEAQSGIREDLKTVFNDAVRVRVQQKIPTWQAIMAQGGTLDDLDVVSEEIRLGPDLHALAVFYGFDTWQALLTPMLQPAWTAYHGLHAPDGSLSGFARANGYPDLRSWRTALFAPLWPAWRAEVQALAAAEAEAAAEQARVESLMLLQSQISQGGP